MDQFQDYCNDLIKLGFTTVGVMDDNGDRVSSKDFDITPDEFNDIKYILINERPDHNKSTITVNHVTYNDVKRTFENEYVATCYETGVIIAKTIKCIIVATYTNKIDEESACKHIRLFSKFISLNNF